MQTDNDKILFITVGTTEFDELLKNLDSLETINIALKYGYT